VNLIEKAISRFSGILYQPIEKMALEQVDAGVLEQLGGRQLTGLHLRLHAIWATLFKEVASKEVGASDVVRVHELVVLEFKRRGMVHNITDSSLDKATLTAKELLDDPLAIEQVQQWAEEIKKEYMADQPEEIVKELSDSLWEGILEFVEENGQWPVMVLAKDYVHLREPVYEDDTIEAQVVAKSASEHKAWAVVLRPNSIDLQNDWYLPEDVEKTAHDFLENYNKMGTRHIGGPKDSIRVIESFIAKVDQELGAESVKAGDWVLGVHINDPDIWTQVENGTLNGLSIEGLGRRTPKQLGVS
jgi:hypothetical protein